LSHICVATHQRSRPSDHRTPSRPCARPTRMIGRRSSRWMIQLTAAAVHPSCRCHSQALSSWTSRCREWTVSRPPDASSHPSGGGTVHSGRPGAVPPASWFKLRVTPVVFGRGDRDSWVCSGLVNPSQGDGDAESRTSTIMSRASPEAVSVLRKYHRVRPAGVDHREVDREYHPPDRQGSSPGTRGTSVLRGIDGSVAPAASSVRRIGDHDH